MRPAYKFSLIGAALLAAILPALWTWPADAQSRAARRLIQQAEAYCDDLRGMDAARGSGCYAQVKDDGSGTAILEPPGVTTGASPNMDKVLNIAHGAAIVANFRRLSLRIAVYTSKPGTTTTGATTIELTPEASFAVSRAETPAAAHALIRQQGRTCTYKGLFDEPECRPLPKK